MKSQFFLLSFVMLAILSCQTVDPITKITFDFAGTNVNQIQIGNVVDAKYKTLNPQTEPSIDWQAESDGEVVLVNIMGLKQYVFLQPGAEVTIGTEGRRGLKVSGSLAKEQELMKEFDKQMSIANGKYNLRKIAAEEPAAFIETLNTKYSNLQALISSGAEQEISSDLSKILADRIQASKINDLITYPNYYRFINQREVSLPPTYDKEIAAFDHENEKLYYFEDAQATAINILGKDLDYDNYPGLNEVYKAQYGAVDQKVQNQKVAQVLKYNLLNQKIEKGAGAGGMEDELKAYLASSRDQTKVNNLQSAAARWSHLQQGMVAPDFVAYTRDGEEVKLTDLKGKNVYIDVWATWCGPCIREIPALKVMEEKYHDQNVSFVSVSIDKQQDKEKWKRMVEEKELGGTQIMADRAWQSDIAKNYNIGSIPRFLMIDSEGAIVSADAPRPSNQGAFDNMLSNVLD